MKKGILRTSIVLAIIGVFMLAFYYFIGRPFIAYFGDPVALKEYLNSKGIMGYLVFGLFVTLQTASNCIPGLPCYLAAGYVLGGLKGALLCDLFATIGNTIAFVLGRKFGRDFLLFLFPEDKLKYVEDIVKSGKPKVMHAVFMFLPLPKDTYAWVGYYSGEGILEWMIITFVARFWQIFLYTCGGHSLVNDQYIIIVAGSIFAAIVYVGALFYVKRCIKITRNSKAYGAVRK